MKKSVWLLSALMSLCSAMAFANDGGLAVIEVKKIETTQQDGWTTVKATGPELKRLMQILPGAVQAGVKDYGKHVKELALQSSGQVVIISCRDIDYSADKPTLMKQPECTINIGNSTPEELGDSWIFNPATEVCKKK